MDIVTYFFISNGEFRTQSSNAASAVILLAFMMSVLMIIFYHCIMANRKKRKLVQRYPRQAKLTYHSDENRDNINHYRGHKPLFEVNDFPNEN